MHFALALLQCDIHMEYVPSKANPADIPSRNPRKWTEGHTEVLRKVKVDQQSNRRDFILPAVEHLANPWAAMGAMARLCAT